MADELEPVEIEITMRQNVSEESQRASDAMTELGRASEEAMRKLQAEVDKQTSVMQQMRSVIEELQNQIAATPPDLVPPETISRLESARESLDIITDTVSNYRESISQMNEAASESVDISDLVTEATNNLSESEQALVDIFNDIIQAQQAVNNATQENTENTEENSDAVEQNSIKGMLMEKALGEIAKLLGIENQALITAVTNTENLTKVKGLWTKATTLLNTQLGISIGLSKALVATGIGLLIAAIAAVVYAYKNWKEEQDEVNKGLEDNRKLNESAAASASKLITTFNKMHQEYSALGDNLQAKKKYIDDNQKSFDQLGISVNNVNDADNLFIANADNFRKAIMIRAQAAASMDLAAEKYKQGLQKMHDADVREQDPTTWEKIWNSNTFVYRDGQNVLRNSGAIATAEKERKEAEKFFEAGNDIVTKGIARLKDYTDAVKGAGIAQNDIVVEGTKAFYEKQKQDAQNALNKLKAESDKESKEWKEAQTKYNDANQKLKLWDIDGQNKSSLAANKKTEKESEKNKKEADKANEDLAKKSIDFQNRIAAARISAMKEGYEKQKAMIEAEYAKEKAMIVQELKEIAKLEEKTGKPATQQREELIGLDITITSGYEAKLNKLKEENKKAISEIFDNVNQRFRSELDNNLSEINRYYDDQVKAAREAGASIDEINTLRSLQEKDRLLAYTDNDLRKNELNEEIELIKAQGLQVSGLTEQYEKRRLEIMIRYAQRRLALLRKSAAGGNEQAKEEIAVLEENLKNMQASLNKPVSVKGILDEKVFDRLKKHFISLRQDEESAQQNTQKFFQAFHDGGNVAVSVIGEIQDIIGSTNETLNMTLDAAMSIAQGFAQGGLVGGITAAASSLISTTTKLLSVKKEVDKSMIEGYEAYIKAIDKLIDKQIKSLESLGAKGIFDTYNKTVDDLNKKLAASRRLLEEVGRSGSGTFSHSLGYKANKMLAGYNSQLKQAGISTSDIYKMTNKELITLQQIPEVWAKLHADLRKYIEDLSAAQDELDNIDDLLKELVMGLDYSQVTDAIIDSITDPSIDNAMLDLEGKVDNMIGNIIKNILSKNMLIEPIQNMVNELWKSVDIGGNKISFDPEAMQKFKKDVLKQAELFQGAWNEWSNVFSDLGISFEDSADAARQGASRGIATASQDSINELNGGIYAIRQQIGDIRNLEKESLVIQQARQQQLNRIVENTEYCRYLEDVKNSLDDIQTRGIKVKV